MTVFIFIINLIVNLFVFCIMVPLLIYGMIGLLLMITFRLNEIELRKFRQNNPPYCDIDPRKHPAFYTDGKKSWIGNVEIPMADKWRSE